MKKLLPLLFAIISVATSRAYVGETHTFGNFMATVLSEEDHEVALGCSYDGQRNLAGDVTLPSSFTINGSDYSVVEIRPEGFAYCLDMTSVTIPGSVISIGDDAFISCISLVSVEIPRSVTEIGSAAFKDCQKLGSVIIPKSVTAIGYGVFVGCHSLSWISVEEGSGHFVCVDGVLFNKDLTELIMYPGSKSGGYVIPSTVTTIYPSSFERCSDLTAISITGAVTRIGYRTFAECNSLSSVIIPESVTCIDDQAFMRCSSLVSVSLPASVTSIGNEAFRYCSALASVSIPDTVTSIGTDAFYYCRSLASVTIPRSLTRINDGVFEGCTGITSIDIPETVTSIGKRAFEDVPLTSLTIPPSVTSIGSQAFWGCALTSLTIPVTVTELGDYAFGLCKELASVTIHCPIGENTFIYCNALTSVTFHDTVTSIGKGSFKYCNSVPSVTIPGSIKTIENETFYNCTGLTSVIIPQSVSTIRPRAFYGCTSLEKIVDLRPEPPFIENDGFQSCFGGAPSTATIYVPKGSAASYSEAGEWNYFADFREMGTLDITLDKSDLTLNVGDSALIEASVVKDGDIIVESLSWSSANPEIATVDGDGKVTAVAEGSTTIILTVTDGYGVHHNVNCTISVRGISDSISDIPAGASCPIEIYNLRGIRIAGSPATLSPGIYILRQGSSTRKLLVK